ncbi:MAG: Ig-like domain-containing protein, partial [Rhodospirillales bacterium]
ELTVGDTYAGGTPFNGLIDELRLFSTARTVDEIAANYNVSLDPTAEPNLAVYNTFDLFDDGGATVFSPNQGTLGGNLDGGGLGADPVAAVSGAPIYSGKIAVDTGIAYTGTIGATDAELETLSYLVAFGGDPGHGTLSLNPATGDFTYTPDLGYAGLDSFKVAVDDASGNITVRTIVVDIQLPAESLTLTLTGSGIADVLEGGAGNDYIDGLAGADDLYGFGGDDTLIGGAGQDTLTGGSGSDRFVIFDELHSDTGAGNRDFITDFNADNASSERDFIVLEGIIADGVEFDYDVSLLGGGDASVIRTGNILQFDTNGDAILTLGTDMEIDITGYIGTFDTSDFIIITTGTTGNNTYLGRTGDDWIVASTTGNADADASFAVFDTINFAGGGAGGFDTLLVRDTDNLELWNVEYDTATDDLNIILEDTVTGFRHLTKVIDHNVNTLDYIEFQFDEGGGPLERFALATGFDASAATENTLVAGTSGIDTLIGSAHDDILLGNDGADNLDGGAGDDLLIGGLGADILDGGAGDDTVSYFQNANDGVIVNLSNSTENISPYMVGAGTALDIFNSDLDTLSNIENAEGSDFNDVLIGNDFENFLSGQDGDDKIMGGGGADILEGGAGIDVFIYASETDSGVGGALRDVITDFQVGIDWINLEDVIGANLFDFRSEMDGGNFTGAAGTVEARFNNETKILEIDTNQDMQADMEIELQNVDGASLSESDFVPPMA